MSTDKAFARIAENCIKKIQEIRCKPSEYLRGFEVIIDELSDVLEQEKERLSAKPKRIKEDEMIPMEAGMSE